MLFMMRSSWLKDETVIKNILKTKCRPWIFIIENKVYIDIIWKLVNYINDVVINAIVNVEQHLHYWSVRIQKWKKEVASSIEENAIE